MALDDGWMKQAACREEDTELFFPEAKKGQKLEARGAKAVCKTKCEVRRTCLAYAIAHRMSYGVWGGLTHYERSRIPKAIRDRVRVQWFNDHPTARPINQNVGAFAGTKQGRRKRDGSSE